MRRAFPRRRGTLKEEVMTRKLALVAGVLFSFASAGGLSAQTSATTKPVTKSSSMQHAPAAAPTQAAKQDSTKARATTVSHTAWTKEQIREAQAGLAKAGYYKGQPTGVLDRRTRKALRSYQKANKLPVTGRLNQEQLEKLHSS
jgi:peptidoglycan hydrolase-like protein with peptidoglycan-binding domain